jgi:hypothetical protein
VAQDQDDLIIVSVIPFLLQSTFLTVSMKRHGCYRGRKEHRASFANVPPPIFIDTPSPKFINEFLGKKVMEVNHGLHSCTQEVESIKITLPEDHEHWPNRRLVLVDTPGFDDTERGEPEILRKISVWLASALVSSPFTSHISPFTLR